MGLLLFLIALGATFLVWKLVTDWNRQGRSTKPTPADPEQERLEACGEVVRFFANSLGHEARLAISRQEVEELINRGVTATELVRIIDERCQALPGVILGSHRHFDFPVSVKLPEAYRDRHVYVIGKSGYGKTTLLRSMAIQDMVSGHGVGIIAPEQEMLLEEILPFIPEHRIADVVFFNPADAERPVCFNPLHLDEGEDLDLKVDETSTIFRRILGEGGPRMDEILRNALYALTELPGTTLLDVEPLLDRSDESFRRRVVAESKDERTVHFFRHLYPQFPKDAHLPIVNRLGRLLRPKPVRNSLCHSGKSLNFRKAMDEARILLFNLSDGILGEEASQVLGQLVVSKFQMATMSRADISKEQRRPFYLYVDEFQTFVGSAGVSYEKILSRARKYKLGLVLAHQQTGQIPLELLKEIFGNVSTLVAFQVSQSDASKIAKEFVSVVDGGIVPLEPEQLLTLKVGEAYCKIGQNAFPMRTEPLAEKPDRKQVEEIIDRSRRRYGVGTPKAASEMGGAHLDSTPRDGEDPLAGLDPERVF